MAAIIAAVEHPLCGPKTSLPVLQAFATNLYSKECDTCDGLIGPVICSKVRQEWRVVHGFKKDDSPFATKEELLGFFEHLERELDASGFLRVLDKRPVMVRNIRNMFLRNTLTAQEVRTLRGIVTSLTHPYHSRKKVEK